MPVKPTPVVPSPAATLVLLRDRPAGGVEVLLLRRHRASRFAPGDFVFPGGKLEPGDGAPRAVACCAGPPGPEAARRLGLAEAAGTALAYWIAAVRETFEEVGVLLARDGGGAPARLDPARLATWRRACRTDHAAFWSMLAAERLTLATDRLVYFAHWITPEERPLRFDTRFFAAPAPAGQEAVADAHEITEVRWLAPRDALAAAARGELSLRTPTARNLELFDGAASAAAALARLADRPVTTVRPRLPTTDGAAPSAPR